MCSTVVKLRLWRSSRADGADDLIAEFDHHTAAEAHHMRQLGERCNRIFAFRALSQREGVVLKRYAGVPCRAHYRACECRRLHPAAPQ
jgi:hypothetical protein